MPDALRRPKVKLNPIGCATDSLALIGIRKRRHLPLHHGEHVNKAVVAAWRERLREASSLYEGGCHLLDLLAGATRQSVHQERDEALRQLRVLLALVVDEVALAPRVHVDC